LDRLFGFDFYISYSWRDARLYSTALAEEIIPIDFEGTLDGQPQSPLAKMIPSEVLRIRVHAYLHRKEGDPSNAAYWYQRAGKPPCRSSLRFMVAVPPIKSLPEQTSQARPLARLATTPCFLPLVSATFFAALGNGVAGSYLTLFAVDRAHLSPLALGIFLTVDALSGVIMNTCFGRWFDRAPSPVPLVLALLMTISAYTLLSITTNFYLLLLIGAGPLGTSLAVFPQLFALAKGHLDRVDAHTAERGTAMMRATWSIAWAVGPTLGALIINRFDFSGVFLAEAMCAVTATIIVISTRVNAIRTIPRALDLVPTRRTLRQVSFAALSLLFFHMAMFMGLIPLPIVATHELGGTKADVGLIFSLCAFLEVPVLFAFVLRPSAAGNRGWISAGFIAFIAYFLTITWAPSVSVLLAAQVLRAIGIGLIAYQGISYMQALMPNQTGAATTLFSNTANAGFLFASLSAGGLAQAFGYRSIFLACVILSVLGFVMMQLQPKPGHRFEQH
jgi:MFS transporter, SET family, sugar efflux transporter